MEKVLRLVSLKAPIWLLLLLSVSFACRTATSTQIETPSASPTPAVSDDVDRKTSEPYTGDLAIFEDAERDKNLQINRVMDILKISAGKTAADIGAGSGWFSVRAAKRVGSEGHIFAVEINQEYIDHINKRAKAEGFTNITTVLAKEDDPLFEESPPEFAWRGLSWNHRSKR